MSTTLPLPGPGGRGGPAVDPAVDARAYAAAVRAELDDLPPEVVEELAGGLEADLGELAAESSTSLADRLGHPRGYATELRSAAGLPPRGDAAPAGARRGFWARTGDGVAEDRERMLAHLRSQRWWPGAVERAHVLRPAWWVGRWLVLGWLLVQVGGAAAAGLGGALLVLAVVALSVEVGRGRWAGERVSAAVVVANGVAVLLLPFALAPLLDGGETVYVDMGSASGGPDTSTGVWVDGRQVTNLYPYDALGQPLTDVQLLDDQGRQVSTSSAGAADRSGAQLRRLSPVVDVDGSVRWNAYPLREQAEGSGASTVPPLPEPSLPALVGAPAPAVAVPAGS